MVVFLLDFGGDPHHNQEGKIFYSILYIWQFSHLCFQCEKSAMHAQKLLLTISIRSVTHRGHVRIQDAFQAG